ncbi:Putative B3 domain-containing protein Os03g0621600 [Linum perenne]
MASSSNPVHAVPPAERSRTPPLLSHFFPIIVDHELHSKKLVDITRDNDGISCFSGHWDAFYAFYSITYGHLLLFRNVGSSRFSVVIFDLSACEIEYPIRNTVDTNPLGGSDSRQENDNATTQPANEATNIKEEADSDYKETQSVPPGTQVHHFQSNYPFFRVDLMNCRLSATKSHIPMDFLKEYLTIRSITPVILENRGNVWEARAYLNGKKYVYISWQKFSRSNSITSEDICYFELLATVPLIRFRVTVF